jgi:U3 small nucleolar RNA-associated protein 3
MPKQSGTSFNPTKQTRNSRFASLGWSPTFFSYFVFNLHPTQSVGATIQGQQYLITKAILQKSIALNSVMYLLLKSSSDVDDEGNDSIQAHPITDHIKSLYSALEKFEDMVKSKTSGIDKQIDSLVKAAALLRGGTMVDDEGSESEKKDAEQEGQDEMDEELEALEEEDELDDYSGAEAEMTAVVAMQQKKSYNRNLNEARFGLRPDETRKTPSSSQKRQQNHMDDFGDLDEKAARSDVGMLASTINSIEQRSQSASRKRRAAPIAEQLDELDEDDRLAQGIKMMEEELGKLDGDDDDDDDYDDEMGDDELMGPDTNDESLDFYKKMASKTKSKKAFKKSLYQVAPKFPRSDTLVDGERAISKTILKNRGLVAHKAKINRNPRVKKREQYRKALIRRKGAVRTIREGEGHMYGGEGTGIKSNISRSRKL